ncbi:MAG: hypothetical protein NWS83_02890 [Burkholderiaceae bacterium]|jgi:hypothetical protein|nr:hypothetical protein [Burkholderiaceae bacterium]
MNFINSLIGILFRLVFMAAGLVFVAGLVVVAVFALALSFVWSLVTGQRHPLSVVWGRFRQTQDAVWRASQRGPGAARGGAGPFSRPGAQAAQPKAANDDVVDVVDLQATRLRGDEPEQK